MVAGWNAPTEREEVYRIATGARHLGIRSLERISFSQVTISVNGFISEDGQSDLVPKVESSSDLVAWLELERKNQPWPEGPAVFEFIDPKAFSGGGRFYWTLWPK